MYCSEREIWPTSSFLCSAKLALLFPHTRLRFRLQHLLSPRPAQQEQAAARQRLIQPLPQPDQLGFPDFRAGPLPAQLFVTPEYHSKAPPRSRRPTLQGDASLALLQYLARRHHPEAHPSSTTAY